MLRFTVPQTIYKNKHDRDLVYDTFKYEYGISFILSLGKVLLYCIIYYIPLVIFIEHVIQISKALGLLGFAILGCVPIIILLRNCKTKCNPFYPNRVERFVERNIRRYFITPRGKALSRSDLYAIKKQNSQLYWTITSEYCDNMCYSFARDVALCFPDAKLIYCAALNPFKENDVFAHAIFERNNEIYDTNRRMSYKKEEYERVFQVKIYKAWAYDEFSKESFYTDVRKGFVKWCQENNVGHYSLF